MDSPLVSVCIPVHNVTRYLAQAIRSVLDQSYANIELVIANGASQVEPRHQIGEIVNQNTDSRIQIIHNPGTFSMVENWNSAVAKARGAYLKLLCADDVLMPDCLQRQVGAMREFPNIVLASGARVIINRAGKRLFIRNGLGSTGVYSGKESIRRCLFSGTNIIGDPVNVLWRRSAMERVGSFDPEILYCTDVEFWLRLLGVGDLYFDERPVGFYRIHPKAAAKSLAKITVADFVRTAQRQAASGSVTLPPWRLKLIRLKSQWKNRFRQAIYNWLG